MATLRGGNVGLTDVFYVCLSISVAFSFNIDLEHPLVFRGPNSSFFGYSVLEHYHDNTRWWVQISAVPGNVWLSTVRWPFFPPTKRIKLSRPVIFCIKTALFPNSYNFPWLLKALFLLVHPATSMQTPLVTHPLPVSHVHRVIVGAPKANSTYSSSVRSPGAVYKCRVHSNPDRRCTEMDLGRGESHERVLCICIYLWLVHTEHRWNVSRKTGGHFES